jgi:arylsulfatase A-like enzyme
MYARTEEGPWVLYDLHDDPYEMKNLARDPSHAPLRARMEAELATWMERTGDSWAFDSTAHVEDGGRLYRFEAFSSIREYLDWAAKHPALAPRD